ncbi:Uncaracterized surface protein containing fasciclin [Planctomycetales bacterium 10988]|nr:Uncaracterized surface protein containing fasciclin [Planctomycetales bacterium 10988]
MKFAGLATAALSFAMAALISVPTATAEECASKQSKDIVETAVSAGSFNTLAQALEAAGLVEALQGDGPFTVFAPTDEAFENLPPGALENLLQNPEKLKSVLTYHVVSGKVPAKKAMKLSSAPTLNGQSIEISTQGDMVMINQAKVIKADIHCSNGIIHVIDQVILPE